MRRTAFSLLLLVFAAFPTDVRAGVIDTIEFRWVRSGLRGQLLDYTNNHGSDRRVWSPTLCKCRDLYVYLPPCYDAGKKYPVVFYFHGFAQDERSFLGIVSEVDSAVANGTLPPTVVVAVDGSPNGSPSYLKPATFYINSKIGAFEDYVMTDVWDWAHANFSLRPEREAHVFAGASMGGGAAFDLGMRHRDRVGVLCGIFPPLNLRYVDCKGRYMRNFDPCCVGMRTEVRRWEVIACYYGGLVQIRLGAFVRPLFGYGDEAVAGLSEHNPFEHLDRLGIRDGEQSMYVAYGSKDQFNLDAQVESFLHAARERGIRVDCRRMPNGKHDNRTAHKLLPCTLTWLGDKLRPYAPTCCNASPAPSVVPVQAPAPAAPLPGASVGGGEASEPVGSAVAVFPAVVAPQLTRMASVQRDQETTAVDGLYRPQPGDIVLFQSSSLFMNGLAALTLSHGATHAAIVVAQPDGRLALLETPLVGSRVAYHDMSTRLKAYRGKLWIRRPHQPITDEQNAALTAFAEKQNGKRYDIAGFLALPLALPRHLMTPSDPHVQLEQASSWFCSSLALGGACAAGLADPSVVRPRGACADDLRGDTFVDLSSHYAAPVPLVRD